VTGVDEEPIPAATRARHATLVTVLLWVTLMVVLVGDIAGRPASSIEWLYVGLVGGIVGDIAKVVAMQFKR
jgi:hypothetical protein